MMRGTRSILTAAACRQRNPLLPQRACYATSASSLHESLEAMKKRPPKVIEDHLYPMPSHLLTTTLNDLLPPSPLARLPSRSSISARASAQPSLPQGHHLVYFPIQMPPSQLAPDGTDPDHSPGLPFTRRMWAGGEVVFQPSWEQGLVLDGRPWVCSESIDEVRVTGREGEEKVFVSLKRRYGQSPCEGAPGGDAGSSVKWQIDEVRTLVFMREPEAMPSPPSSTPPRTIKFPHTPDLSIAVTPTATHLFNFSALTYNAHAIHLDRDYARRTDGHHSLLVHGPLTLALMLRVLSGHVGHVARISYRNIAPLYVDEPLTVCVRDTGLGGAGEKRWDVWIQRPDGGLAVKGNAVVQEHGIFHETYD